ncbi:MAG: hypothetical protein JXQ90_08915 [Cyclobacteriaceae bacterium]
MRLSLGKRLLFLIFLHIAFVHDELTAQQVYQRSIVTSLDQLPENELKIGSSVEKRALRQEIRPAEIVDIKGQLEIKTIGQKGLSQPRRGVLKPDIKRAIYNEPITALDPRFKDAATMNLQYLDVDQGLGSSYVWSLAMDKVGNFWAGTYGGGIYRYDGVSFYPFSEKEGLLNDFVSKLIFDSKGRLWIGTNIGLSIYDGTSFYNFSDSSGLPGSGVWDVFEDSQGIFWLATEKGVFRVRETGDMEFQYEWFDETSGLQGSFTWTFYEHDDGSIWSGNDVGVDIFRFSDSAVTEIMSITPDDGIKSEGIWNIEQDKTGAVWLGTNGWGAFRLVMSEATKQPVEVHKFYHESGFVGDWVWDLTADSNDNLWVGSYGNGLAKLEFEDNRIFTSNISEENGLSNNYVVSIQEDGYGSYWFGTYGGGIAKYNELLPFQHFTEHEGLSSRYVLTFSEDRDGAIWFGTEGGGITKMIEDGAGNRQFEVYDEESGLLDNWIWDIIEDKHGQTWVASDMGISIIDASRKSIKHLTSDQGLVTSKVWALFEDSKGNIWIGTEGAGIMQYSAQTGEFAVLYEGNGQYNKGISSMLENEDGSLLIGVYGEGLKKLDRDEKGDFYLEAVSTGLQNEQITSLIRDDLGSIWVGTEGGGVSVIQADTTIKFNSDNGLSNNYVWSILQDQDGKIWITTENGLNEVELVNGSYEIRKYERQDGLKAPDFYTSSGYVDSKDRKWWGGGKSLTMRGMTPTVDRESEVYLQLNNVKLMDSFVDFNNSSDQYFSNSRPFYNVPESLVVPYDIDHIAFSFSAIGWMRPKGLFYKYRLVGLTEQWNETQETSIDYRNLDAGDYKFELIGRSTETGDSEMISYSFHIDPAPWHTWWARSIYLVLVVYLALVTVRWRTNSLRKNRDQLRRMVNEKTKKLQESNVQLEASLKEIALTQRKLANSEKMAALGQVSAGIAHEINNPISAINNIADILIRDLADVKELLKKYESLDDDAIKLIKHEISYTDLMESLDSSTHHLRIGATRTLEIIRGLRNYSRLDTNNKVMADIHEGLDSTLILLNNRIKDIVEVEKQYDERIELIECYYGQLNQVFMNIISNAIDALGEDGKISICTEKVDDQHIEIRITDNGAGISEEIRESIFEELFTTKEVGAGTGLGLSISNQIIQKHGGTIRVNSALGQGSTFIISLPIY